jgi:superfamily II DNA/RNA helicase
MEWNADWIETVSTKVALLLTRLRAHGFFHKLPVNEMWWHNVVVRRVVHSTAQMRNNPASATSQAMERAGKYTRKVGKCIVFSNFIEAIDNVANSLTEALNEFGIFMRFTANMKGGAQERIAALKLFRDDPNISILLLDGVGAVGLDLSFVSHIFLLDPIWDKSLEDQVISRAHRLGAKQAITVEKLIATGTVEQMMEQLAREHNTDGPQSSSAADAASVGAPEEGDVDQGSSSGDAREHKRQRGDEIKRQREVTKIQNILVGLSALPYDPGAEREREDMVDFLRMTGANHSGNQSFPNQPEEDRDGCMAPSGFIAASSFQGSKQGFVFKNGQHGVGYYLDISARLLGVATVTATGQEDVDRSAKRVRFSD